MAMGGRLVGAAVAGVLVLGGGVVAAEPAAAVPVVRVAGPASATGPAAVRTAPARQVRVGLRAHQITDHAASRRRHKTRRSLVGRALDAVFGWVAFVALVVLLIVVLLVYSIRRRKGR
ncbi:hypothetical protein [Kitasatospora cathayae]|uniref:Uncharacterized protein n=1 Tax=Kitasatospora cathayae TaxID=3004092 RepID=A0ABY7Q789_9ACTN|nr:hypothetical protein [Kitasatospora sp. HUAS 3-15]WBP88531.1 hypothetical protein O1G21_23590 [Kitasatospora sp. HUAS 3-15]